METREVVERHVELALSTHEGDATSAAETCRRMADWWQTVQSDTATLWRKVAEALEQR